MDIAEVLKVRKRAEEVGYIVPIIEEQIIVDSAKDSIKRRRDVFHPSEICFGLWCPREWLLCQREPSLYQKVKISKELQKRFDVGKVMHSYIQKKLGNAGVLFGVWECLRFCDDQNCTNIGFKPKKEVCKKAIWTYKEPTVIDEELHLYGNVDGIIVKPPYKYTLEYKTINDRGFSTLIDPVYNHREQSMWYLDLLSRGKFHQWNVFCQDDSVKDIVEELRPIVESPYDGSIIVYQNKDDQSFREYKTDVKYDSSKTYLIPADEALHYEIEQKKKKLKDTINHLKGGTLCERLYQCDDPSATRARKCVATKECFKEG